MALSVSPALPGDGDSRMPGRAVAAAEPMVTRDGR